MLHIIVFKAWPYWPMIVSFSTEYMYMHAQTLTFIDCSDVQCTSFFFFWMNILVQFGMFLLHKVSHQLFLTFVWCQDHNAALQLS